MSFGDKFQKWQGVILSGSIILNVFLIGFLVARIGGPSAPQAQRAPMQMVLPTLPPNISFEAKEEIENEMHLHQEEVAAAYERLTEVQEEINRITSEHDLDKEKLEAAFEELSVLENTIRSRMRDAYAKALREINRENRRAITQQRRERIRAQRLSPKTVDGTRWNFSVDDGKFEFNLDELKDSYGFEGLEDLENLDIIITREFEENGPNASRYIFIDRNGVLTQEDLEFIEKDQEEKTEETDN